MAAITNLIPEVFVETGKASLDQQVQHSQHQLESLRGWGWGLGFQGGVGVPGDKGQQHIRDLALLGNVFPTIDCEGPTLIRDVGIPGIRDLQSRTH